jgi:hypothetical protein
MKESLVSIALITLLVLIVNPIHLWMPSMLVEMLLVLALVAFGSFAVFVLREHPTDEREGQNRMFAGRTAFLAGAIVLMLGIIIQSLRDALDVWLVYALVAMIIAKIFMYKYSDKV